MVLVFGRMRRNVVFMKIWLILRVRFLVCFLKRLRKRRLRMSKLVRRLIWLRLR